MGQVFSRNRKAAGTRACSEVEALVEAHHDLCREVDGYAASIDLDRQHLNKAHDMLKPMRVYLQTSQTCLTFADGWAKRAEAERVEAIKLNRRAREAFDAFAKNLDDEQRQGAFCFELMRLFEALENATARKDFETACAASRSIIMATRADL